VARAWFVAAALVCLAPLVFLARVVQALSALGVADAAELAVAWALLAGLALALLLALARPAWTRASLLAACLLVLASFQAALAPLNGPAGRFELGQQMARVSDQAGAQMGARVGARVGVQVGARGKSVAVFSPFNSSFERYEMLLPQALLKPYEDPRTTLPELLARHDWVLWASPAAQATPPPCAVAMPARCRVLAVRWDLKSRHNSGDIRWDNLLMPQQWLLQREWLLTADGLR
jgi:hypothetical protein